MKRIIIPTLLFSNVLFSKSVPLKASLILEGNHETVNLKSGVSNGYKVRKGDSLSSIAHKHHVSLAKLRKTNHLSKNHLLRVGTKLQIPGKSSVAEINFRGKGAQSQGLSTASKPLLKEAKKHLGKRYVWAANGPSKFDCSGFTKYVCNKNGITIPRTSIMQAKVGKKVSKNNLRAGDLIFFDTSDQRKGYVNHVGIYLGNNKFIHASSAKKKVMISSLSKNFYKSRFKWGRRVN
ncbi:MAG: LysM peptidoglycan-binding domain-containing C40 family peptidase [Campylobacterota bacterium]|nr:LysM peptidoglycan-binding domain-containing C40 family peptidase [Campylobacterota bacterium]